MKTKSFLSPIILIGLFLILCSSFALSDYQCNTTLYSDNFNYHDVFSTLESISPSYIGELTRWDYMHIFATNGIRVPSNNTFGINTNTNTTNNSARIIAEYFEDNKTSGQYKFSFVWSDISIAGSYLRQIEFYVSEQTTNLYGDYSGVRGMRIDFGQNNQLETTMTGSVTGIGCNISYTRPLINSNFSLEIDLNQNTYTIRLNNNSCSGTQNLASIGTAKIYSSSSESGVFEWYLDDFNYCYVNASCSFENPSACTHIGQGCIFDYLCSDVFLIDGNYNCDLADLSYCGVGMCVNNSCSGGEICTPSWTKCCSDSSCINVNESGNVYSCDSTGYNWTLWHNCFNLGCEQSSYSFATCINAVTYYCLNTLSNACFFSSVNVTGNCYLTNQECQNHATPGTGANGTIITSGDLAQNVENFWCQIGVCSIASRVIIALILMIIIAIGIFALTINQHSTISPSIPIGIVEVLFMILAVYIKLLPIWIPILLAIFGIGVFIISMSNNKGG